KRAAQIGGLKLAEDFGNRDDALILVAVHAGQHEQCGPRLAAHGAQCRQRQHVAVGHSRQVERQDLLSVARERLDIEGLNVHMRTLWCYSARTGVTSTPNFSISPHISSPALR